MLTVLESLYCVLFVIAAIQGARVALELGQPRWLTTSGTIAAALGTAGMLLHLSGDVSPSLAGAWRFVVGLILLHLAVELAFEWRAGLFQRLESYGRPGAQREPAGDRPPASGPQARSLALTGTALALLFALPMLWMNVGVAWGG